MILSSFLGFDASYLDKDFLKNIEMFEPRSATREGVCFSASMYLLGKIINESEINENSLIQHAKELQNGVPGNVAAIQQLNSDLKFQTTDKRFYAKNAPEKVIRAFHEDIVLTVFENLSSKGNELNKNQIKDIEAVVSNVINEIKHNESYSDSGYVSKSSVLKALTSKYSRAKNPYINVDPNLESLIIGAFKGVSTNPDINKRFHVVSHLYGFNVDVNGTIQTEKQFGSYVNFKSSNEQLENLKHLDSGHYIIEFNTRDSRHAVLYLKGEQGQGYLFDPNNGLIKCEDDHKITFLKMLSLYEPPTKIEKYENQDRNYHLNFTKFKKSINLPIF